jgi:hypothetical protein
MPHRESLSPTRREALGALPCLAAAPAAAGWTEDWDRAVLAGAVAALDRAYDRAERMLVRHAGPEYRYHTNMRSRAVHPTRDSLEYALLLLETGEEERRRRAEEILDRLLALQETDSGSKWYGLWGYYLEEPAPQMSPADWNWADFNGATLLLVERRHGAKLPAPLRRRALDAIRHAAASVGRRNVSMSYTNIAVKGTFVTLAASELLEDRDLNGYATVRRHRLARQIDLTGSFDEYNSPTYAQVAIANLTRIGMLVRDPAMRAIAGRIHHRAWLHLGKHWHAPTRQLAGPMSRCYSTDIGAPLWIQKALGGRLEFASLEDIRAGRVSAPGETAVLAFQCPNELMPLFLTLSGETQHRELFLAAPPPLRPVMGATYLTSRFCLGSANRSDFWVQRRPLLAYWGGASRPARSLHLRLIKDDYDFSSGLFYSVQERNCVLGVINFRSPGGDKHISLDPVPDGRFSCSRLRVRADLAGVPEGAAVRVRGGRVSLPHEDEGDAPVAVDLGGVYLWLRFPVGEFGGRKPRLSVAREENLLAVSLDLHRSEAAEVIEWARVGKAWAAVLVAMQAASGSLEEWEKRLAAPGVRTEARSAGTAVRVAWNSPAGQLWVDAGCAVAPVERQNELFREYAGARPVPVIRLSEEKIEG